MAEIKIITLSPVHIGSGRELMANTEFIEFGQDDERTLTVIDEKKVLDIIGEDHISQWIQIINRKENLKDYLLKRKPGLLASDIEKRSMLVSGGKISNQTTLKEQMHSAGAYPMIPGSSIKGAIRSAVIEYLVEINEEKVRSIIERKRKDLDRKKKKWTLKDFQFTESDILNKLLSNTDRVNANRNTFRFLQVGDAVFKYDTIATNVQVLNLQSRGWEIKKGTSQLTEAIGFDCETEIRLKINTQVLNKNILKNEVRADTSFLKDTVALFEIVNTHTKNLLQREIDFWDDMEYSYSPELIGNYLDSLKNIKDTADACKQNEAVLRIGGGSGWDFITGAWAKTNKRLFSEEEWYQLSNLLNKGRDADFFPKTRKLDEDGDVLGFVKFEVIKSE